jgi:hypothetical protein
MIKNVYIVYSPRGGDNPFYCSSRNDIANWLNSLYSETDMTFTESNVNHYVYKSSYGSSRNGISVTTIPASEFYERWVNMYNAVLSIYNKPILDKRTEKYISKIAPIILQSKNENRNITFIDNVVRPISLY